MASMEKHWQHSVRGAFSDRQELPKEKLFEDYFAGDGLPKAEVLKLFDEIEANFGVPAGLLRPSDALERLTPAVSGRTLWEQMIYAVRKGDRAVALMDQLESRYKKVDSTLDFASLRTVGDLVRAWCRTA